VNLSLSGNSKPNLNLNRSFENEENKKKETYSRAYFQAGPVVFSHHLAAKEGICTPPAKHASSFHFV
jgi:hypothetical protein